MLITPSFHLRNALKDLSNAFSEIDKDMMYDLITHIRKVMVPKKIVVFPYDFANIFAWSSILQNLIYSLV